MKTIVNKLRFALLLGFIAIGMAALAQNIANIEKMSMSTQMFLDEMAGKISFDQPKPSFRAPGGELLPEGRTLRRPIASPDTIDGEVYISAFIRVSGEQFITDLEKLGVQIMCKFDNGLMTTNIPINMIEEVAAIEGVTQINVAELMEPDTDLARQATNVDDVLTLSQDAALAGLQQRYDGSGVVLAVIDNGVDFQHIAFKDKNGNSRIKRAYKYDGSSVTEYNGSGSLPSADATNTDHGTHTSSIAGGSSVIVNGTNVTVTDDHANATYGGMAPGADLFLAGINGLTNTYIVNAFQKAVEYADAQGKPLVVSNSYSNGYGPRDGNYGGDTEDVIKQYFGESHPNRICLFAASNRAGNADPSEGGGLYATGTSSSSNPLGSILRYHRYSNADNGYCYNGTVLDAWGRSTTSLGIRIYVLDNSTGAIITSVNYTPNATTTVSGLSNYYDGSLTIYTSTNSTTGKRQIRLYANAFESKSYNYDQANNYYTSNYTLAVEVYPTSGSSIIDMWAGSSGYFTNFLSTSGHNWVLGSDDVSVSDHAVLPEVISVGSYVTRGGYGDNSVGDISEFSGYAVEGVGPLGTMQPWIAAPGEVIISAFNHSNTSRSSDPLVNNTTNPYGTAQGTSMATPMAAGIVALWFQAAQQIGKDLTLSEVKNIMAQTAIHDQWTSGANGSHFGNGKINALAGIEYILDEYAVPTITADPNEVTFEGEPGKTYTQTITVGGVLLTGDITATLNDPSGAYSINTTNLGSGGNLVITYTPTGQGSHNATITLTSAGAEPVTITINGTAAIKTDTTICDGTGINQFLPVYGYYYESAQTNQMLYPSGKFTNIGMNGNKITKITFYPTTSGSYSGINFYNNGSGTVTVKLANMPSGTTGYTDTNPIHKDANFVTVKTITMPTAAQTGLTEWVFEDLENDFTYEGGDLLIEVTTTAGRWGRTYFAGENQTSYTSYYSYGSTKRGQQFLPKVKFDWESSVPITAGTVSPNELTFTDVPTGRTQSQTITVTNTGNQNFTPIIDTTGLPSEFTVSASDVVVPGGTLELTVTYTPTSEGTQSGTFTITIGDQTYTVTVTGNGIIIDNTLTSNEVMVPVYKTDLDVYGPYSYSEIMADVDRNIVVEGLTSGIVKVQTEQTYQDGKITEYRLFHNAASKNTSSPNWADVSMTDNYVTFAQPTTETWLSMIDDKSITYVDTWYVPVIVANSDLTTDNTYGARMEQNPTVLTDVNVSVGYDDSSRSRGPETDTETGDKYVYLTIGAEVSTTLPTIEINGHSYAAVLARAWREYVPYVPGVGEASTAVVELIDQADITGSTDIVSAYLGSANWSDNNNPDSVYQHNAYTICVKNGTQKNVKVYGRIYYMRDDMAPISTLRGNRGGEGGGFGAGASGSMPDTPTGVNEFVTIKEVVDVTYVNPLGMTSKKPFSGVNIIVTRYSDGTTSTQKILR